MMVDSELTLKFVCSSGYVDSNALYVHNQRIINSLINIQASHHRNMQRNRNRLVKFNLIINCRLCD
jgi:hypothetical protein